MTATLLAVSAFTWQKHQVLLPVLVVNASGQRLPGKGFYESLRSYRPNARRENRQSLPGASGNVFTRLSRPVVASLRSELRWRRRDGLIASSPKVVAIGGLACCARGQRRQRAAGAVGGHPRQDQRPAATPADLVDAPSPGRSGGRLVWRARPSRYPSQRCFELPWLALARCPAARTSSRSAPTTFSPGAPTENYGPATDLFGRFLWGLFAGDRDKYDEYLAQGGNKDTLQRALLAANAPVMILIDELIDYAQELSDERHVGQMPREQGFLNALMDACDDVPRIALVVVMIRSELDEAGYKPSAQDFRFYISARLARNGTSARSGLQGSMGRVASAGDNAAMESFWALLQNNVLDPPTLAHPRRAPQRDRLLDRAHLQRPAPPAIPWQAHSRRV